MWKRIFILLGARLRAGPREGAPVAAVLYQLVVASFFCGLVRDALPPFAYGVFAFTLTGLIVAIPLIGELGWLLRRDEAGEWVGSLPIRPVERKIARTLHVLTVLWILSLGSLLPAAVLAPEETSLLGRAALPILGLGLVSFLAALLLAVQNLLGERAEGLLIALQTVLVVGVVVGLVLVSRSIPALAELPGLDEAPYLWGLPPAWFAAPLSAAEGAFAPWWLPLLAGGASVLALLFLPTPAPARTVPTPLLSVLLRPVRGLCQRVWLRPDERGPFDLVFDALPREREVILRTVPMVGIPLAFLVIASTESGAAGSGIGPSAEQVDLFSLLFFTAGIYLPILLTHVPGSATPEASWIHRLAPVPEGAVVSGTIKALAAYFLVPLFTVLGLLAWSQLGPLLTLRLVLPGFLLALLVLRRLHATCVSAPPLSVRPAEIRFDLYWSGPLLGVAMLSTLLAILASRLQPWAGVLPLTGALLVAEFALGRSLRRRLG